MRPKSEIGGRPGAKWLEITPTLLRQEPYSVIKILVIAAFVCIVTVFMIDTALLHEIPGILAIRPIEVSLLVLAVSVLISSAIFLHPLLLINYRQRIYVEEEFERLNLKYREGLQEFQSRRRRGGSRASEKDQKEAWRVWERIVEEMSLDDPDYQDFAYLHLAYLEILYNRWPEIESRIEKGEATQETSKKEILRKLINATAEESLEDTTYDLSSYIVPVSFCMLAVAFGFVISSLIPFLGTSKIELGNASINLIWALGGFIGVYIYSFLPFFQRCTRGDMPPRAFLHYGLKVFLGPIVVTVLGNLFLNNWPEASQFAVAVVLGSTPLWVMGKARKLVFEQLGWFSGKDVGRKDVFEISGITYEHAERLHEEGIMNIQNLAFSDTEDLSKRTKFNQKVLFDWKDEAVLRLLTGNVPVKGFLKPQTEKSKETEEKKNIPKNSSDEESDSSEDKTTQKSVVKEKPKKDEDENLYGALRKVGISTVTTLATRLEKEGKKADVSLANDIVKLLGWKEEKEYQRFLEKICSQGVDILGEISKPTITAFAVRW